MNPKSNAVPTTLYDMWKLHPTRRAEWSAILKDPASIDAFSIIREKAFQPKPMPAGTNLMEWSALMNQRREGYLECLASFLDLAKVSPFVAPPAPAWESLGKEQRLAELERELAIPEDTRLPNSPVKPTQPPQNGPAPVPVSTTGETK